MMCKIHLVGIEDHVTQLIELLFRCRHPRLRRFQSRYLLVGLLCTCQRHDCGMLRSRWWHQALYIQASHFMLPAAAAAVMRQLHIIRPDDTTYHHLAASDAQILKLHKQSCGFLQGRQQENNA